MSRVLWAIAPLFLVVACSSSDPEPGTEQGPCYPNGTCNEGLVCLSNICVRSSSGTDAGTPDGGSADDGGPTNDAGDVDSGTPVDAGPTDGGPSDAGGSCTSLLPSGTLGNPIADACAAEWCCPEMDRCAADQDCASCAARGALRDCGANQYAQELRLCALTQCMPERQYFCFSETLGSPSSDYNACGTVYCCNEFEACEADQACLSCLANGCSDNTLADAFRSCLEDHCSEAPCDTGLSFGARNPFECRRCLEPTCCTDLEACVGGSVPATPTDVQMCVDCVNQPSSPACANASPAVQQGAADAQMCFDANCSAQCEKPGAAATVRTLGVQVMAPQTQVLGEVVSAGDSFLRERGACVGRSPEPTFCLAAAFPVVGSYATSVPSPELGAIYYARAYAVTRAGKVYGDDVTYRAVFRGDVFEGGIVFYTEPDGMHGLIASPNDLSTYSQWWDSVNHGSAMTTGATGTAVGTGAANTTAIVNTLGAGNYAAKLCDDLDINGFSDWYLPSKDELDLMYQNRAAIGNLSQAGYWSSSEVGTMVWIQNLSTGFAEMVPSINNNAVRAIRSF